MFCRDTNGVIRVIKYGVGWLEFIFMQRDIKIRKEEDDE